MQFRKLLIFRTGHLGDFVVALPALWAVRQAFPDTEIALLSNSDVRNPNYISAQSVLPPKGLIDRWEAYPTNAGPFVSTAGLLRLALRLRMRRYDAVIYLMTRSRTPEQIERDRRFFKLAGIHAVLGAEHVREASIGSEISDPHLPLEREADFLLDVLASAGIEFDHARPCADLRLSDAENSAADAWLRRREISPEFRLVGVAPGSKWGSKVWPEERFAAVVGDLIASHGIYPVVLGGPEDRAKGERLIAKWATGANAAGELTVRESAALLARCELYLGNDTGTMHLAAAVGTPCVAIFAAIDRAGRWEPFGEGHVTFREAVECQGCHSPTCFNRNKCLDLITSDRVLAACSEVLARSVPQKG
ncbi:MAG: glycosyltransferase family 9 protein [Pyrinomonadaceae bacterium]